MTLNAHKVFKKATESTMNLHSFIHKIIAIMITSRPSDQEHESIPDDPFHHLSGRHFILVKKAPPKEKEQHPKKRCRVCYAHGIRSKNGSAIKTLFAKRFHLNLVFTQRLVLIFIIQNRPMMKFRILHFFC